MSNTIKLTGLTEASVREAVRARKNSSLFGVDRMSFGELLSLHLRTGLCTRAISIGAVAIHVSVDDYTWSAADLRTALDLVFELDGRLFKFAMIEFEAEEAEEYGEKFVQKSVTLAYKPEA